MRAPSVSSRNRSLRCSWICSIDSDREAGNVPQEACRSKFCETAATLALNKRISYLKPPERRRHRSRSPIDRATGIVAPPAGVSPDTVLAVHPTQLYETALGFVMFLILWRYRDHKHAEGWLFGLYGVLAGVERLLIEFVRAKDDRMVGPFTLAQLIAIAITLGGLLIMQSRRNVAPGKSGIYARA